MDLLTENIVRGHVQDGLQCEVPRVLTVRVIFIEDVAHIRIDVPADSPVEYIHRLADLRHSGGLPADGVDAQQTVELVLSSQGRQ